MQKKNKRKKAIYKITVADYLKAVKKADREIQTDSTIGFSSITKIHKSKKTYNRQRDKKNYLEE